MESRLRVAVRPAASGEARPERLKDVLKAGVEPGRRPDVLEHPEGAAGSKDAPHLGECARRIRDGAENEAGDDGVEGARAERKALGGTKDEGDPRAPAAGRLESLDARIETDRLDVAAVKREVPARPAAEVEDAPPRPRCEPAPPAPEAGRFEETETRVVERWDLLDSPHGHESFWKTPRSRFFRTSSHRKTIPFIAT